MDDDLAAKVAENSIRTRDGLGELAVDELTEMTGIDDERASKLIMAARAHSCRSPRSSNRWHALSGTQE